MNTAAASKTASVLPWRPLKKVKAAVGDTPVGYRFLADEWMPDGLQLNGVNAFAERLAKAASPISPSWAAPMSPSRCRKSWNGPKKKATCSSWPRDSIKRQRAGGRRRPAGHRRHVAEQAIAEGKTDLIGLARVLWADPLWPQKVREGREADILHCSPDCGDACMHMVMKGRPAFCVAWPAEK
jgi:NADPH2 dehydrogenase